MEQVLLSAVEGKAMANTQVSPWVHHRQTVRTLGMGNSGSGADYASAGGRKRYSKHFGALGK